MTRGITLRTLLVGLTLCSGLLVLFLTLSGVGDVLRDAGVAFGRGERALLSRSLLSTQFVRGLIGIALALALAAAAGSAASRLFTAARTGPDPRRVDADEPLWLREARDVTAVMGWMEEANRERVAVLARGRDELDRLLEAVSEGILHLDGAGRVIRANRAARRLLSLPDDAVGQQIGSVVRSAELRQLVQRALQTDGLPPREITFEERTLVVTARTLISGESTPDPEPAGLAVAVADLTALRRLESVRRDFVANASHELKTPLTSIRGYAETLRDETLSADTRRQFVGTIASNAERLQHIVDDLLDLSRLESGTWQPALAEVSAQDAVIEAWRDFAQRAERVGVRFDLESTGSYRVLADASALRQILGNLFDNALRHTADGDLVQVRIGPMPRAASSASAGGTIRDSAVFIAIDVRDTGAGIPGDALPRIFERFYRVESSRARDARGTGLGLAIVRHLTESMGGTVEAQSRLGRGTTIRVLLPTADGGAASVSAS